MFALLAAVAIFAAVNIFSVDVAEETTATSEVSVPVGPEFNADSAYSFCAAQCAFGPRIMNSTAHDRCENYIIGKFKNYGMTVMTQKAFLTAYDGTKLNSTNIIASYKPEATDRVLLCAHWDSRPWADNDPDEKNHKTPVLAANDGASGVAVLLEIARLLSTDTLGIGVDFICFDAEDGGSPQWADKQDDASWALGSQYWAAHPHKDGYTARYGILFDMVGGQGATFYREQASVKYASDIVDKVWEAAQTVGYSSLFPNSDGGWITDDHISVNTVAKIPTVDIIPYYPDCNEEQSSVLHGTTVSDDMEHIDRNTLKAVGQTAIQVLFSTL